MIIMFRKEVHDYYAWISIPHSIQSDEEVGDFFFLAVIIVSDASRTVSHDYLVTWLFRFSSLINTSWEEAFLFTTWLIHICKQLMTIMH